MGKARAEGKLSHETHARGESESEGLREKGRAGVSEPRRQYEGGERAAWRLREEEDGLRQGCEAESEKHGGKEEELSTDREPVAGWPGGSVFVRHDRRTADESRLNFTNEVGVASAVLPQGQQC